MPAQRRQGNVVLIAMISLAAVFSLTRLYAPPVAPSGADASAALAPLRAEIARLQQQKELTQLEIAEETLRHERLLRSDAIDTARSGIGGGAVGAAPAAPVARRPRPRRPRSRRRAGALAPPPARLAAGRVVRGGRGRARREPGADVGHAAVVRLEAVEGAGLRHQARARARRPPISWAKSRVGRPPAARRARRARGRAHARPLALVAAAPPPPAAPPAAPLAPPSGGGALRPYLEIARPRGAPRPKVTVLVWNKIRGFLDWLREDFLKDALQEVLDRVRLHRVSRRAREGARRRLPREDALEDRLPRAKPKRRAYLMVSMEQPAYAPLMKDAGYLAKFDGTAVVARRRGRDLRPLLPSQARDDDLESTLPMITVHPHWDAPAYFEAEEVPFERKRDAAVMFTSNCKNAGAQKRLALRGADEPHGGALVRQVPAQQGRAAQGEGRQPERVEAPDPRVVQVLPRVRERRRQGLRLGEGVRRAARGHALGVRGAATVDALLPGARVVKVEQFRRPRSSPATCAISRRTRRRTRSTSRGSAAARGRRRASSACST